MTTEDAVYRELQEHLDKLPIGYPAAESGADIRVLRHLFTPEEAKLATQLSWTPESAEQVFKRVEKTGTSLGELEQLLERMFERGSIERRIAGGEKLYSNALLAIGMYENQLNRLTREFLEDYEQYFSEAWVFEAGRTEIPQLRTIPVSQSVPDERFTSDYDSARHIVDNVDGQLAVASCVCRQHRDIMGQSCSRSDIRETCLLFDREADNAISRGAARPISKHEALHVLERAQDAGFVLQPSNSQKPEAICCCCGDCCGVLSTIRQLPRPADYYASNHYAEVDVDLCSGCEECVEQCQLDAVTPDNGTVKVNLDRCIGCGNCVVICPADAIALCKKEQELVPPKDNDTLYDNILAKKSEQLTSV
jgi:NAD-dependent dihydropyrimidine dehydrogenase PreA subunit